MHNEDTARFLQREGGDTFCFINTRDVKTLIETTKYSPKIDKTFQKRYVKLSFCHISIFLWFCDRLFTRYYGNRKSIPFSLFRNYNALLFLCLHPSYLERINCFVFSPCNRIGFLYHNAFRALITSCISKPHGRVRHLGSLMS